MFSASNSVRWWPPQLDEQDRELEKKRGQQPEEGVRGAFLLLLSTSQSSRHGSAMLQGDGGAAVSALSFLGVKNKEEEFGKFLETKASIGVSKLGLFERKERGISGVKATATEGLAGDFE